MCNNALAKMESLGGTIIEGVQFPLARYAENEKVELTSRRRLCQYRS
jgi:hypothetical protein